MKSVNRVFLLGHLGKDPEIVLLGGHEPQSEQSAKQTAAPNLHGVHISDEDIPF